MQCWHFLCHRSIVPNLHFPLCSTFTVALRIPAPTSRSLPAPEVTTKHGQNLISTFLVYLFLRQCFAFQELCYWKAGAKMSNLCLRPISSAPEVPHSLHSSTGEVLKLFLKPCSPSPYQCTAFLFSHLLQAITTMNGCKNIQNENKYIQRVAPRSRPKSST